MNKPKPKTVCAFFFGLFKEKETKDKTKQRPQDLLKHVSLTSIILTLTLRTLTPSERTNVKCLLRPNSPHQVKSWLSCRVVSCRVSSCPVSFSCCHLCFISNSTSPTPNEMYRFMRDKDSGQSKDNNQTKPDKTRHRQYHQKQHKRQDKDNTKTRQIKHAPMYPAMPCFEMCFVFFICQSEYEMNSLLVFSYFSLQQIGPVPAPLAPSQNR